MKRAIFLFSIGALAVASGQREPLYQEKLRPQFHFTARYWDDYRLNPPNHEEGWINDLNGLVHFDGTYHLFAQRWWSAWLHAVSDDLVHWKEMRPAFGKGGRFGGTQSGGGVIDHQNMSGLGDGKTPPMLAFWSSTDNFNQCMSYSLDRGLTWTKYAGNPVLRYGFRDPKVFWHEPTSKWIMILYGPSDDSAAPRYGYNGENNDAHDLREAKAGKWMSSVMRVYPDGRVVIDDASGQSEGKVDGGLLKPGNGGFFIGTKADGTEPLMGAVSDILVYDRPLSDTEAKCLVGYLEDKKETISDEGLRLRLDANRLDERGSDQVETWQDLSVNGRNMVQANESLRPRKGVDDEGRGYISFSGVESLRGSAVLEEGDGSFTIAARWKTDHGYLSQVICEQNSGEKAQGRRAALLSTPGGEPENHYLLFESGNLLDWKRMPGSIPDSYECPDMFELPVLGGKPGEKKWVILDANGDYIVGSFDGKGFVTETGKRKGDYGRNFYATMSFENMPDSDPRRVQLAWMRAWDEYPKDMPFNQQISFPCELTLHKHGDDLILHRNPVAEISKLYQKPFALEDIALDAEKNPLADLQGELFDIELVLDVKRSECEKLVLNVLGSAVEYDLKKGMLHSHGSSVQLAPQDGRIQLRVLVDRLSVETFGNEGMVSLTNFAIRQERGAPLSLNAEGGVAHVSSVKIRPLTSIWKDYPFPKGND